MKFFAKATGKKKGEIYVYEQIGEGWFGGITAKSFQKSMEEIKNVEELAIYINSPGGNVFDGVAIYNMIKRHEAKSKKVYIDGIAASIASIIALAGNERIIASNGMFMIHDPWGFAMGRAEDMRKQAESLDKVRGVLLQTYVDRTTAKEADLDKWMSEETWMDADEALERGFATEKSTEDAVLNNSFSMFEKFSKVPEKLKAQPANDVSFKLAQMQMRAAKLRGQSREQA